jgi:hypothetical protein
MQTHIYPTLVAACIAVFVSLSWVMPVQAAQKKPAKTAHRAAAVSKPHAKVVKAHSASAGTSPATLKKGHKAIASKPASRKRAGTIHSPVSAKTSKKAGQTGAHISARKAPATNVTAAKAIPAKKRAAKPHKVKKAAH